MKLRQAWATLREWVVGEARIIEWEHKHVDYSRFGSSKGQTLWMHKERGIMRDITVRLVCAEGETVIPMENVGDEELRILQWLQDESHRLSSDPNPTLTIGHSLD